MNDIKKIAERLLDRELCGKDGISSEKIESVEASLSNKIPVALKSFYLNVGRVKIFTSAFFRFISPQDLFYEKEKLVFLEENQMSCYWGISIELDEDPTVYQMNNGDNKWFSEEIKLSDFLQMVLYCQCTEGGYEFSGGIYDIKQADFLEFIKDIESKHWKKVVNHNGWVIYENGKKLIWYYLNDMGNLLEDYPLFVSTSSHDDFLKMQSEFGFEDLD